MLANEQQLAKALTQTNIHAFCHFNKVKTEKGTPIEWDKHFFLFDIYNDWTPVQAIIKASQVGFSTMVILKALWAAKYNGWNIIYTLPTGGDVNEFVSSKVNKIIDSNSFLKALVKDKDTIYQKQIGKSVIFFKGTTTGKEAGHKTEAAAGIMISSDLNIHDESDRSDQTIIEQFESRLDFSQYKGRWYFSNPTVPNIGAHKWFIKSDQKHYFHKCSRCNKWFYLEWTDACVDKNNKQYQCPKCHKPLREADRARGEWVAKHEGRDVSGYWINQMMSPWKSCAELVDKEQTSSKTHFMNFCLGLPYIGSDVVVNREVIVKNIVLTENKKQKVAMGVDNGIEKHFVIGNEQGIFQVGKTQDWDEIERLRNIYDAVMVVDALPYPKKPTELVQKYQHKVFMNFYKKDKDDLAVIRFQRKEKSGVVYSDRTKLFDEVIAQFYAGKIVFNLTESALEEYIRHWESLYLAKTEDSMGIERVSWESARVSWESDNGNDHYAHATLYWYVAMQRLKEGSGGISDITPEFEHNYNPVIVDGKVQDEKSSIEYIFEHKPKKGGWT